MASRCQFLRLSVLDFAVVGATGVAAVALFGDRHPELIARLTLPVAALLIATSLIASVAGSWAAWRLRLPARLGSIPTGAFHALAFFVTAIAPVLGLAVVERFGLWVLTIWAGVASYAWGFLVLNTKHSRYAG